MTTPADRGWGPGWPNAQIDKIVTLKRSDGLVLPVRREVVSMIRWLCDETERRGYNLLPGQCWGFSNRPIAGTRIPSNHSWGLAVDLNSLTNPRARVLITDIPKWMVDLWSSVGWYWGGFYKENPDPMHFEYMGTIVEAKSWVVSNGDDEMTPDQVKLLEAAAQKATDAVNYAVLFDKRLAALEQKVNDGVNYDVDAQKRLIAIAEKLGL